MGDALHEVADPRERVRRARALFPVTERFAYFNVAACAPFATPVRDALVAYAHDLAARGAAGWREWFETHHQTRTLAARLIGADPAEVAFVRNTSEGLLFVANGLALAPGDSIVVVRGDFPANVHPWLRQRRRGVDVRFVEPDEHFRLTPDRLLAACDATTRLVAVSFVSFSSGHRLDVAELGARLHERGILLCVDAIQGLGVLPLDVAAGAIDFLAADAHKWLLAPEGIGVFYVRRALLDRLEVTHPSWLSMKDPYDARDYREDFHDDARRFEYATPNTAGIHALKAALELIEAIGIDALAEHALSLTDRLCAGLAARGWRVRSPRGAGEKSGIVAFDRPGLDASALSARLEEQQIIVASRGGAVRASAHVYNDASDVERLLDALPR